MGFVVHYLLTCESTLLSGRRLASLTTSPFAALHMSPQRLQNADSSAKQTKTESCISVLSFDIAWPRTPPFLNYFVQRLHTKALSTESCMRPAP